jgi:hypothetical protein
MARLTHKEKTFAVLALLLISLILGSIVYFVRIHGGAQGGKLAEASTSFLYGLLASLVIALAAFAFKPFQTWLQAYLATPDTDGKELRILLFGQTGCGKTSFATYALTAKPLETIESTPGFIPRSGTVSLNSSRNLAVVLGDYRGEEPSQATAQIPESFAGPPDNRLIDAVIFFVDLIGREHDHDQPDQVLNDEKILEWLREAPTDYVTRRINQHKAYLSAAVLEILFSVVYSVRLKNVFFLVTKADLIWSAATKGVLPGFSTETFEASVVAQFSDVVDRINAACVKNDIPPCIVSMISLRDESARAFVFDALGRIDKSRGGDAT